MRYLGMPAGMWALFVGSFRRQLTEALGYDSAAAAGITKKAHQEYRALIQRPRFREDVHPGLRRALLRLRLQEEREEQEMIKTTLKIDGMMCGMCEAHVAEAIRRAVPAAKKVSASRGKGEATFLTEDTIDEGALKAAIDATGYICLGISSAPCERKGWFGWR